MVSKDFIKNYNFQTIINNIGGLFYLLTLVFPPLSADASNLIYTIQVGSFEDMERAARQYHLVINSMKKEDISNLRVEKIAKYYSIRVGNFEDPIIARDYFSKVKPFFPSSILLKAYMKNERIIKLYSYSGPMNKSNHNDGIFGSEISEIRDSLISDEKKEMEDHLFYTIQIGSFATLARAQTEFASVMQKLIDSEPDYVRIEKIGKYHAVRIGKFEEYMLAESYLSTVKTHFESAFIIHAYIRDNRIVKELRQDLSQTKNGMNINAKSFSPTIHEDSFRNVDSTGNDRSEEYSMLPISDKFILHGTVITKNTRLAIIEDRDLKQSGLYYLNDQVRGFTVSDILENTVILNKNNALVKIVFGDNRRIASTNSEPHLSGKIEEEGNQGNGGWVGRRGERIEKVGGRTYRY
jgi:hypothetical protein